MAEFPTALQVLNSVAVELGLKKADMTAPYSETDQNIVLLRGLLTRVGRQLVRKRQWTQLTREYTFSTVASTASYALPSGFSRIKDATQWNRTTVNPLGPAMEGQGWQEMKARTATGFASVPFRIFGNLLHMYPTPTAVGAIYYEYISGFWVLPVAGTPIVPTLSAPTTQTDTLWFDEDLLTAWLRYAFLKRKGLATQQDKDDADEAFSEAASGDGAAPVLTVGRSSVKIQMGTPPDTGWGL
jgi:hypothetical protein